MKPKYWVIIFLTAAAIGTGLLAYTKQPTLDLGPIATHHVKTQASNATISLNDLKDWKTYKNEEYGFEVKYPSDWIINSSKDSVNIFENGSERPAFRIQFSDKSVSNIKDGIKNKIDGFLKNDINEGELEFSGFKSDFIDYGTAIGGYTLRDILFTRANKTFWIEYVRDINPDAQILSTFKFISTSTPSFTSTSTSTIINTSSWTTYKNEKHGFEFKYPKDWILRDRIAEAECKAQDKVDCNLDIVNYDLGVDYIFNSGIPAPTYCQSHTSGIRCEKIMVAGQSVLVDWQSGIEINSKNKGVIFIEFGKYGKANKESLTQILSTFKFIPFPEAITN